MEVFAFVTDITDCCKTLTTVNHSNFMKTPRNQAKANKTKTFLWKQEFWNTEAAKHLERSFDFLFTRVGRVEWGGHCIVFKCVLFSFPLPSKSTFINLSWIKKKEDMLQCFTIVAVRYLSTSQNVTVILVVNLYWKQQEYQHKREQQQCRLFAEMLC